MPLPFYKIPSTTCATRPGLPASMNFCLWFPYHLYPLSRSSHATSYSESSPNPGKHLLGQDVTNLAVLPPPTVFREPLTFGPQGFSSDFLSRALRWQELGQSGGAFALTPPRPHPVSIFWLSGPLPEGPSRTKNAMAPKTVVFYCCRSVLLCIRNCCHFPQEKQDLQTLRRSESL